MLKFFKIFLLLFYISLNLLSLKAAGLNRDDHSDDEHAQENRHAKISHHRHKNTHKKKPKFYNSDESQHYKNSECRVVIFSRPAVREELLYYEAIKRYQALHRGKEFIIPSEFASFIENNKEQIYSSYQFSNLEGKFQRFAKTYSKDAFVYVIDTKHYNMHGNSLSLNVNGVRSTFVSPMNCEVVDLGKTAIEAILGERALKQINNAQQGKYIDIRNNNDSEFSLF